MATRRTYHSQTRQRQAQDTRTRILDAARVLMLQVGYAAATIEQIAGAATVAPQTVRAAFTKPQLLAAVLERAAFGITYDHLVGQARQADSVADHIATSAAITCHIYRSLDAELTLLRSAGTLTPELHDLDQRLSAQRRARQIPLIEHLRRSGDLRADLDEVSAADIVWTLTSHALYRLLVNECGWTPARYQHWLTEQLTTSLVAAPTSTAQTAPRGRPVRPESRSPGPAGPDPQQRDQ